MTDIKKYILADKNRTGEFAPTEILDSLEDFYAGLEYGDVAQGEFQIWEYPSGEIFDVTPNKTVANNEYYSMPYSNRGTTWIPMRITAGEDRAKVMAAYKLLKDRTVVEKTKRRRLLKIFRRQK